MSFLWVGMGSALGGMARHGVAILALRWWGAGFPLGTLLVNGLGSFLIGCLAGVLHREGGSHLFPTLQHFILVGFLGGFTTFSSFSLQTMHLAREGRWELAAGNIVLSLLLCLCFVWIGFRLFETPSP